MFAANDDAIALDDDSQPDQAVLPPSRSFVSGCTPVFPAIPVQYLLDQNERLIARIKLCYGENNTTFEDEVLALIRAYAVYVHLLPASQTRGFSDPGGLFRLGLEVGFFALQGTDAHIFCGRATISERRVLEPRWRLATFIAGLCSELHLALGTLTVTNTLGEVWPACLLPLSDWLQQRQSQHYTVEHMVGDASASVASRGYGVFALPHVVPPAVLQDLASCNTVIVPQLLASISGLVLPQPRNVLDALVRRSLALVVERNLLRHSKPRLTQGSHHHAQRRHPIGLHHQRFVIDAMRHLMAFNSNWAPNSEKSRVHWGQDGLFLVWPFAGFDLIKLWEQDKLAGLPKNPASLLNFIADLELCDNQPWPAQERDTDTEVDAQSETQPHDEPVEAKQKSVQLHPIRPPGIRAEFQAIRIRYPDMLLSAVQPAPVQLDSPLKPTTTASQTPAAAPLASNVTGSQGSTPSIVQAHADDFAPSSPTSIRSVRAAPQRRTWRGLTEAAQPSAISGSGAMSSSGLEVESSIQPSLEPDHSPTQLTLIPELHDHSAAPTAPEGRTQKKPALLSLIAPLRLNLALRNLLNQWLTALDAPQPEPAAIALVVRSDGLFIPLQRFETQGFPAFEAIRGLADLQMLASIGDDGSPSTTHMTSEGTHIQGIVLSPSAIQGWPPRVSSPREAPTGYPVDGAGSRLS